MSKKKERYPRARAIVALGKGDHLLERVETVAKRWVDVWFDGAEKIFSDSKAALASGSNPWLQIVGTSSALSLKAVGVTMDGFATLLGCEPEQSITFTFDAAAESTDPIYFEVPKGFYLSRIEPLVASSTGPVASIGEDQIWVEPEDQNKTFWSFKLRNLKEGVADPRHSNPFQAGDYTGAVVFTNDAKDELELEVTATRIPSSLPNDAPSPKRSRSRKRSN
jgi:hypothetical protein